MDAANEAIEQAFAVIEASEPLRLVAQEVDGGRVLIGYGLERYRGGALVQLKDITSPPIARAEMLLHLEQVVQPLAEQLPGWHLLGSCRRGALMAFMQGVGTRLAGDPRCKEIVLALQAGERDPAAFDAVAEHMQRFAADVLGRVNPQLAARRKREAELWLRESTAMIRLRATRDTFLKRAPIEASYLSDAGRKAIAKGEVITATQVIEIPRDGHDWLVLEDGERWAAFMPHWEQPDATIGQVSQGRLNWEDFNSPLGQYITVGEMLRFDPRRRPLANSSVARNLRMLATEFDAIRKAWGGAIMVTSGYRPEPINSEVGGVPGSRHVSGEAIDIYPADGDLDGFYQWLRRRWSGGLGDGRNKGFVHIDMRDGGRFHVRGGVTPSAVWLY